MRVTTLLRHAALAVLPGLMAGCAVVRGLDDAVSPALEQVPVLKMLGVQARPALAAADAAARARGGKAETSGPQAAAPEGRRQALRLLLCTDAWINPNARGEAAPVRIRIAELASATRFASLPAAQLFATDRAAMGTEVREVQDYVVPPGAMVGVGWIGSQPGTLGIAADFRAPQQPGTGRVLLPLDEATVATGWTLYVHGTTLHLLRENPATAPAGGAPAPQPAACPAPAAPPAVGDAGPQAPDLPMPIHPPYPASRPQPVRPPAFDERRADALPRQTGAFYR